jgi:hypothetical protein
MPKKRKRGIITIEKKPRQEFKDADARKVVRFIFLFGGRETVLAMKEQQAQNEKAEWQIGIIEQDEKGGAKWAKILEPV